MISYFDLATSYGGRVFFYPEDVQYVMYTPAGNSAVFGESEARVQVTLNDGSVFYLKTDDAELGGNVYVIIVDALKELND
jgi:hypothetical protein